MFEKIVIIEPIVITESGLEELKNYCKELVLFNDTSDDDNENIKRIGNADCVLTSWKVKITRDIINNCQNLKYIGMGCSLYDEKYSNIDLQAARDRNITVLPLKDYGDEGTVEYIIAELLNLLHGLKGIRWKEKACELGGLKIGIIGLGTIGGMTAKALQYFGADVYYFSKTRKEKFEKEKVKYLELDKLLQSVDVAILSVNRDVQIFNKKEFEEFGNGKILINISLGTCYAIETMDNWLLDKNNYYICDNASINDKTKHILTNKNVIYSNLNAGHSLQTDARATEQTLSNIKRFWSENDR